MITPELVAFIRAQVAQGRPREQITRELMQGGGWKQSDIDEVFASMGLPATPAAVPTPAQPAPSATPSPVGAAAQPSFGSPVAAPSAAVSPMQSAPAFTPAPAPAPIVTSNPYTVNPLAGMQTFSSTAPKPRRSGGFVLWLAFLLILLGGVFVFAQKYDIQSIADVKQVFGLASGDTTPDDVTCAPGMMYDATNSVCVIAPIVQTGDPMTMPVDDFASAPVPESAFQESITPSLPVATVTSVVPEFNSFRIRVGGLYKNGVYVPAEVHFTATYSDGSKATISDMTAASYVVADTSIATVEELTLTRNGTLEKVVDLKGLKRGKTTLTISFGGITKTIPVEVLAASGTTTTTSAPRTTTTTTPRTTTPSPQPTTPAYPTCPGTQQYDPATDTCYGSY